MVEVTYTTECQCAHEFYIYWSADDRTRRCGVCAGTVPEESDDA